MNRLNTQQRATIGGIGAAVILTILLLPASMLMWVVSAFGVVAVVFGIGTAGVAVLQHFGLIAPSYVGMALQQPTQPTQTPVAGLLPSVRDSLAQRLGTLIGGLPLPIEDKRTLHSFALDCDRKLLSLLTNEKIPVALAGVRFGALTVTYRLKLREFSRNHLDRLLKLDGLIGQALAVESVRLIAGKGFVDCEISSPVRVRVTGRTLVSRVNGTNVPFGLDASLRPAMVDISQHGLIAAIAPSRRGKTQAIKTVLALLKKANPQVNIVVIAFKSQDWQAFENCAHLIYDKTEITQFSNWLLAQMYQWAKQPTGARWVMVFDDLVNLLATNPDLPEVIKQLASLGAGVGVTTVVSTQFSGKDSGGTATFANATCRLMFKPSSNLQGARDGGWAGLGLDGLSTQKGDALLLVDGDAQRIATAMTSDSDIARLRGGKPDPVWQTETATPGSGLPSFALNPMEQLIEKINGELWDIFDFESGQWTNKTKALRLLGWHNNTHYLGKLEELRNYIVINNNNSNNN